MEMEKPALLPNIKLLADGVPAAVRERGIAQNREHRLHLFLDGLLANIRLHAHPLGAPGSMLVSVPPAEGEHGGMFRLIIGDSGTPFNPLEHPLAPDLSAAIEDRQPGGIGILLARRMAGALSCRRVPGGEGAPAGNEPRLSFAHDAAPGDEALKPVLKDGLDVGSV